MFVFRHGAFQEVFGAGILRNPVIDMWCMPPNPICALVTECALMVNYRPRRLDAAAMLGSDIPDWAFAEAGLDDLNMTAPIDEMRVQAFRQTSPSERLHGKTR